MKWIYAMIAVVALTACEKDNAALMTDAQALAAKQAEANAERLERLAAQRARVDQLLAEAQACDKNEGIKDFETSSCYKSSCDVKIIHCNDGMSRVFKGHFERQW